MAVYPVNSLEANFDKRINLNLEAIEKLSDVLKEHTESLKLLLSINSSMREEMVGLITRVADMEGKLAYYVEEQEKYIIAHNGRKNKLR